MAAMQWDDYLAVTGQRLAEALPDPPASYLYDDCIAPPRDDPDGLRAELAAVLKAHAKRLKEWEAGRDRPARSNRPGVRAVLVRDRDLTELVHVVAVRASLGAVAEALGCGEQSLRDAFVRHGFPAPTKAGGGQS